MEQLSIKNPALEAFLQAVAEKWPAIKLLAAESTRHNGYSSPPYASLNLGISTEDDPATVAKNRSHFFQQHGWQTEQVASAYQVHGDQILVVENGGRWEGYDALISNRCGVFLNVTVADCCPILVFDPVQQAMGAVHAGWRGTAAQILAKTLTAMQENYGTRAEDCYAYIGTCISECAFEVDDNVADHFSPNRKRWDEAKGKFLVDLKQANADQLREAGLGEERIFLSPFCTVEHNEHFFSYRKEKGLTGRMLCGIGVIV
jgi:polyphenol oxidase